MKVDTKGILLPVWTVEKVYVVYNKENNRLSWTYDLATANDIALGRKTEVMHDHQRTYIDEVSSDCTCYVATVATLEEFYDYFKDRKDIVDNPGIQLQSQQMIALI